MVCDAALNPDQVCIVYLRGFVLFVFTVFNMAVSFTGYQTYMHYIIQAHRTC